VNGKELKELRISRGLSQQMLADATGIPKGTIGRIEASGEEIKKVDVSNTLIQYFKNETNAVLEAKPLRLVDPYSLDATGDKFYRLADDSLIMQVPIIKAKAYAGYLVGFSDPEYFDDLETIPLPVEGIHRGSYLAFEVSGRSMVCYDTDELADSSIRPGWIAIGRDIPKDKWRYKLHTHTTDTWILVHRSKGILIKQISNHQVDEGIITIHSLNPEYHDEELFLEDIEQIFSVVQIINKKR
jgi:transcriptional regulator with XRE-family HTH domain